MTIYTIKNTKNKDIYVKEFKDETDARHWVINHLDLSLDWKISPYVLTNNN